MMEEQQKSQDAIDSSSGLEEQTNFNYYANLFFLIMKILVLGAIVYAFMFLDIFKGSIPRPNNLIKSNVIIF